ncbi:MAG TPA: SPW repeat protein [Candidatus Saccharimonadales bacterium]|nr:SPW repeat protein [Candidatus Saccharimonadales bacterium]
MALAGLVQLFWEITLPSWISGLAAVWLFISAFAFTNSNGAMWSEVLSAIAVFLLSYWDGFEVAHLQDEHKTHAAMR